MPASQEDLKNAKRHLILTGISVLLTIIFLISLPQIVDALKQVYENKKGDGFFVTSYRWIYDNPWGLTWHIFNYGSFLSAGDREAVWRILAFITGAVGYFLNYAILISAAMGLSVKPKSDTSKAAYFWSIAAGGIGQSVILNVFSGYILGFGLMVISFSMSVLTKQQVQSSIAQHEEKMATSADAFNRMNQRKVAGNAMGNTTILSQYGEMVATGVEASVDKISREANVGNGSTGTGSNVGAQKPDNGVNNHQIIQTPENAKMEKSTTEFEDEEK